jgi:hypothetical protein
MPGYFTNIIVRVTIPLAGETVAGQSYPITIKASSTNTDGIHDTAMVITNVEEFIDLELEYSGSGLPEKDFDPNKQLPKFTFRVSNKGNIDETSIKANVTGISSIWDWYLDNPIVTLEPGTSTTFSITFDIPSEEDEGEYNLQVYVTSSDDSFDSDPVNIKVNVIKPDLGVSNSDISGLSDVEFLKSKIGNITIITARIHNLGNSKAESIQVKLYEGTVLKETKTISSIEAGSYKDLDFEWTIVAEETEIKLEITPIEEIDLGNNAIFPIPLDLRPDLQFSGEELNISNPNPLPNEIITVKAYVKNSGGNAEDVVVKFYEDTKEIGMDTLDIEFGEVGEATFTWEVPDKPGESLYIKAEINLSDALGDSKYTIKSIKVVEDEEKDPVLVTIGHVVATEGETFIYKVNLLNFDPNTNLTFSDDTDLFDINPTTGDISFTPSEDDVGTHIVTITVTDDEERSDQTPVTFLILGTKEEEPADYTWILYLVLVGIIAFLLGYMIKGRGKAGLPDEEEGKQIPEEHGMDSEENIPLEEDEGKFGKEPPPPPPPPPEEIVDFEEV